MKIHFNSYIPSWSTMLDILPNSIHSSAGTLICKSWMGGRSSIKISPLVLIGSFFLGLGVLLITFLDTQREKKSITEMLCTLYKSTMYQIKIMFKNLCVIRLATSICQYLSCFKDSGENHYALILFHENTAHTGTYVTSIYFRRIFVEQNYSYKFTWFIINNRKS